MAELMELTPAYEGYSTLYKVKVRADDGHVLDREIEDHGVAAAVLPYDPARRTARLVSVLRPPLLYRGETRPMLEPIAGMIDRSETAEAAIRREAMEEAGLQLHALEFIARVFPSGGVSAETLTLYLAEIAPRDKTGPGGGAEGEDEQVRTLERPLAALWAELEAGLLPDMKLVLLLQALRLRRSELF